MRGSASATSTDAVYDSCVPLPLPCGSCDCLSDEFQSSVLNANACVADSFQCSSDAEGHITVSCGGS